MNLTHKVRSWLRTIQPALLRLYSYHRLLLVLSKLLKNMDTENRNRKSARKKSLQTNADVSTYFSVVMDLKSWSSVSRLG